MVYHEPRYQGQGVILRTQISDWLQRRGAKSGTQRALTAFAFGFAAALALAPTNLFPIYFICFPVLIALLRIAPDDRSAFMTGWSFAFGYFLLGLYWISAAMFVDIGQFWWAVPLAVAGLPAVCAIYYGLAAVLARRIGLDGIAGAISFALIWFVADYARGHVLTGFPWNLEGYIWADSLPMMQSVSVAGIYGLTLLTLVTAALPVLLLQKCRHARAAVLVGFGVLLLLSLWGFDRLAMGTTYSGTTRVRVVQPNIEQSMKWDPVQRGANFQTLLDLSSAATEKHPALIVWPETASTFYLEEDAEHRRAIAATLSEGALLLTGGIRRNLGTDGKLHFANSMLAIDRSGRIVAEYDKFHLVPFGEYIPFRHILPLHTLANLGVDFTAGEGLRTMRLGVLPSFSPLICYEGIFSGEVAKRDDRPEFLINITNDGWYGKTAGPYQHFVSARTRAIEEGLPLLRSANTGISGVVDPYGRLVAKLGLGKAGFVDADLPEPLRPTIFSRYGDTPLGVLFAVLLLFCAGARFRERRN